MRDRATGARLKHEALVYGNEAELLGAMVPYVRDGLRNGERVVVATRSDNLGALRAAVGDGADMVEWADTQEWHPHPATRMRALNELCVDLMRGGAERMRVAAEPAFPPGPPPFVREWERYEAALNAVLALYPVTLDCLYDASRLDGAIVERAERTHPIVERDGHCRPSGAYAGAEAFLRSWHGDAPPPPASATWIREVSRPSPARRFVAEEAERAGADLDRTIDLSVAANEVVTNALVHSSGVAAVACWTEGTRFVCQVEDEGTGIDDPLAGYRPPMEAAHRGYGLWLARQLVDLLEVAPRSTGTAVRLHVART